MPGRPTNDRPSGTPNQPRFLGRSEDPADLSQDYDEKGDEPDSIEETAAETTSVNEDLESMELPAGPSAGSGETLRVEWLDPKAIHWPSGRISSEYDQEHLTELAHSLTGGGQEDPLIVRQLPDGSYEGAGGMNRCIAAISSGIQQVMCIVRDGSHEDVVRANLRTALNQARPNPLSEVEGLAHAFHDVGLSVEEIEADTGKSRGWIEDRLLIHEASPAVKQCLGQGTIAIGHAVLLAQVEDLEYQEQLLRDLLTYGWSVKQLEEAIRGEDNDDDDDDDGTHEVSFTASNRGRSRQALTCAGCGADDESAEVQTLSLCEACSQGLKSVASLVSLLREAEGFLADIPAGAPVAERIGQLLENEEQNDG